MEVAKRETTTVGQVSTRELLVAYPHETLSAALLRMSHSDVGRLPVVDRNFPRRLVGAECVNSLRPLVSGFKL